MKVVYVLLALLITLPITTLDYYTKKNAPGILFSLLIAVIAWFLGHLFPLAGGAVIALLSGILIANTIGCPNLCKAGVSATSKRVLQAAIVLFGFQMNISNVLTLGSKGLILIGVTIIVSTMLAYGVGKVLQLPSNEKVMIGVGTAICGGSAIAAIAPVIKANEREIVTAISTIFLFNILAVFIFPIVGHLLSMSDLRFGVWCGAAINDTSSVVAAAYSYSESAGYTATVVKLTRTLMIIPATFILALYQTKKEKNRDKFRIIKVFPWFVLGFFVACIINTIHFIPEQVSAFWGNMGKFCIMMALTGIGLQTNLRDLVRHGKKPLLLGCCCSVAVATISILIVSIFL